MKNFLSLLALSLLILNPAANSAPIPYSPELDARLLRIEAGTSLSTGAIDTTDILDATIANADVSATAQIANTKLGRGGATDGLDVLRIARVTFDCGDGTGCPVGATASTVQLPAKAIIWQSWIYVDTQFADSGTCTAAVSCEDANNIKTATDITGSAAGAFIAGQQTGAAAAMSSGIAAACFITLTMADGGSCVPSAGKITVYAVYNTAN